MAVISNSKTRKAQNDVLEAFKVYCQLRSLYPEMVAIKVGREIFQGKNKLRYFMESKPPLQRIIKERQQPQEANSFNMRTQEVYI